MRVCILTCLLVAAAACSENPFLPNTDVGLRVWAEISPSTMSIRDTLTEVTVRVYVLNSSRHVIRIVSGGPPYHFTGDPTDSRGLWGSFRVACEASPLNCGPNTDWWGDTAYVFQPRTRYHDEATFTLTSWKLGGWPLLPGQYRIRAWFNGREGDDAPFRLVP